jgi:hypothetical protein
MFVQQMFFHGKIFMAKFVCFRCFVKS